MGVLAQGPSDGHATGYLYRVGQSRTKQRKTPASFAAVVEDSEHLIEPELEAALSELSDRQRTAVLLVFAYGWTLREVAELTGLKVTTIQNHMERGLAKLRSTIGEVADD